MLSPVLSLLTQSTIINSGQLVENKGGPDSITDELKTYAEQYCELCKEVLRLYNIEWDDKYFNCSGQDNWKLTKNKGAHKKSKAKGKKNGIKNAVSTSNQFSYVFLLSKFFSVVCLLFLLFHNGPLFRRIIWFHMEIIMVRRKGASLPVASLAALKPLSKQKGMIA